MSAPLSVTHVLACTEIPGHPVFAGAEHHLFELMHAQLAAGLHVHLLAIIVYPGPTLTAKFEELRAAGIAVTEVHHRLDLRARIGPPARLAVVPSIARILRRRPDDVVHTHLPQASQLGRLGAGIARSRRVVDSVHSNDPMFLRPAWRFRLKVLDRVTDRYIAISGAVRRILVEAGVPAAKISVVPYGVTPPTHEIDSVEARKRLSIEPGSFVVGFVGRLTQAKDVPTLIEAVEGLGDHVTTVIIGGGEDADALADLARSKRGVDIRLTGPLPDAASLMHAFDVFCLPSRWEGLGVVLLEAMWREVPIVASDAGAIPEVLDGGRCGALFPAGDAAALRRAIESVRNDPHGASERVGNAIARVRTHYSVERMVERTLAIYTEAP